MYKYTTNEIIMIQPSNFMYNSETAVNKRYQKTSNEDSHTIQEKALKEFNELVYQLKNKGIKVNI